MTYNIELQRVALRGKVIHNAKAEQEAYVRVLPLRTQNTCTSTSIEAMEACAMCAAAAACCWVPVSWWRSSGLMSLWRTVGQKTYLCRPFRGTELHFAVVHCQVALVYWRF